MLPSPRTFAGQNDATTHDFFAALSKTLATPGREEIVATQCDFLVAMLLQKHAVWDLEGMFGMHLSDFNELLMLVPADGVDAPGAAWAATIQQTLKFKFKTVA